MKYFIGVYMINRFSFSKCYIRFFISSRLLSLDKSDFFGSTILICILNFRVIRELEAQLEYEREKREKLEAQMDKLRAQIHTLTLQLEDERSGRLTAVRFSIKKYSRNNSTLLLIIIIIIIIIVIIIIIIIIIIITERDLESRLQQKANGRFTWYKFTFALCVNVILNLSINNPLILSQSPHSCSRRGREKWLICPYPRLV